MSFATKLTTAFPANINANNGMPPVLTAIIAEYDGRKYAKVQQEGSIFEKFKIIASFDFAKGIYKAIYEDNNIPAAIEAIKKNGWSNKILKPITSLIEENRWDAIEFIFAQYEGLEDGLSSGGQDGANLWLGVPFHFVFGLPFPDSPHPKKYGTHTPIYYRLLDLWLKYRPLVNYGTEINRCNDKCGGAASVFKKAAHWAATTSTSIEISYYQSVTPFVSMTDVMEIFFKHGLDVNSCWEDAESFPGKRVKRFEIRAINRDASVSTEVQKGQVLSHLAFDSAHGPKVVAGWLEAGLSPNALLFQFKGHRCYSWLMSAIQRKTKTSAALLLNAGADPNQASVVYYSIGDRYEQGWNNEFVGFVVFSKEAIRPLKFVLDQKNHCTEDEWERDYKPLADLLISCGAHA